MKDLYFKVFEKYGAALAALYPSQIETLTEALEKYTATGKLPKMQDSFTRLACMMIICDLRYEEGREKE